MSSWKKAAKANQKTHRERHQPAQRAQLGLLEKKKDYVRRAADYHEKGRTLRLLRRRALDRNPDEFYHHMINSKVQDGEHHEIEKADEHTPEQLKLLQTQDLKYINMMRVRASRRAARLQATLHAIDAADAAPSTHTFFLDSGEEKGFDLAERLDTHPALLGRKSNRPRLADLTKLSLPEVDPKAVRARDARYRELAKQATREKELTVVQQKMELKRHLAAAGVMKPKRIKRGTAASAPLYQFQYQRKK